MFVVAFHVFLIKTITYHNFRVLDQLIFKKWRQYSPSKLSAALSSVKAAQCRKMRHQKGLVYPNDDDDWA